MIFLFERRSEEKKRRQKFLQKAMQNRIELSIEKVYKDWIKLE